jgi:hypothetical protein
MGARYADEIVADIDLEPFPFISGTDHFVDFCLGQREKALLGFVFEEAMKGSLDIVKGISAHLGQKPDFCNIIF